MPRYHDDARVILLIEALVIAKDANKWGMNTHSYLDFESNLYYITGH